MGQEVENIRLFQIFVAFPKCDGRIRDVLCSSGIGREGGERVLGGLRQFKAVLVTPCCNAVIAALGNSNTRERHWETSDAVKLY